MSWNKRKQTVTTIMNSIRQLNWDRVGESEFEWRWEEEITKVEYRIFWIDYNNLQFQDRTVISAAG